MRLEILGTAVIGALCLVGGCEQSRYQGDGTLSDAGPFAANDRYVLDLGPFDMSRPNQKSYEMSGLPETEFTVGIDVTSVGPRQTPIYDEKPLSVSVTLRLTNERGETVISQTKRLNTWTWSGAIGRSEKSFVYLRGEAREIALGGGTTTYKNIGVAADGGWGTYFTPRSNGRYRLYVATLTTEPNASSFNARILAESGGWK